jgi:hypothetical protein
VRGLVLRIHLLLTTLFRFIHDNYRENTRSIPPGSHLQSCIAIPPGVLNIDPETFDTEAALRKYGYDFTDSTKAPKRRALLVTVASYSIGKY